MSHVVVIGGGAAGMMAAAAAAENGHFVELYEKNEKLGKKLYITGKGRCNLTNDCQVQELLDHVCTNRKFLYSAFYSFSSQDTQDFFTRHGLRLKTERGNRVFPVSDHSSDVIQTLAGVLKKNHVAVHLNTKVCRILTEEIVSSESAEEGRDRTGQYAAGIELEDGRKVEADVVIVATGGLSYASTGSTGDGYRFARETGHMVTECTPSLVPMEVLEEDAMQMQGLSLKNVQLTVREGKKVLYSDFGEMMFTHFGVTGPLILTASTQIQKRLQEHPLQLKINLKPAISEEQLDARFLREFEGNLNRQLKNSLGALYPAKLIPVILSRSGIDPGKVVRDVTREERHTLVTLTRELTFTVTALRGFQEAVITRGGVAVRDIHPDTMESKLVRGLYFAGEVLDLDAVTGGFNLQIAWSTGHAAGVAVTG